MKKGTKNNGFFFYRIINYGKIKFTRIINNVGSAS